MTSTIDPETMVAVDALLTELREVGAQLSETDTTVLEELACVTADMVSALASAQAEVVMLQARIQMVLHHRRNSGS